MTKLGIACLRWLAIFCLAANTLFGAADSGATAASGAATQTAYLELQPLDFSLMSIGFSINTASVPFKKEPDFQKRSVIRGHFIFNGKAQMPFIWDNTGGKLYLDQNSNGDFTDDPKGVYSCSSERLQSDYQAFTNVLLIFKLPGLHEFRVDLQLNTFRKRPSGYAELKSFWLGKITLAGQDWQLGLGENIFDPAFSDDPAWLLLRPWKERDKKFNLQDGSLDGFSFARTLFFQNRSYQLACTYDTTAERPRYKVEFKEQQPKLGEVNFTGKFVDRMTLEGSNSLVLLETPGPVFKAPVGNFHQVRVVLKQGEIRAAESFSRRPRETSLTVTENKPAVLAAGGPLTNSVTTQRRAKYLTLNYQLLGANGGAYQIIREGRGQEPTFAIFQGDKQIHSGKFQFG